MSNSVQPHRWQPTRLRRPWDSPGKNTGVGCHFLLQCRKVKSEREVTQSCPTLRDPMDCSPPGSSVHGIFQARVLEWGAIAFSIVYSCLFCHRLMDCRCVALFLGLLSYSIDLYFCLCASTIILWLLSLCNIVWGQGEHDSSHFIPSSQDSFSYSRSSMFSYKF